MGVKLSNAWMTFRVLLAPRGFDHRLRTEVCKATRVNGLLLRRLIRQKIRSVVPPALSPMTAGVKGSSKPLVDRGDLWKSVTSSPQSWDKAFVGVLRTAQAPDGGDLYDVAKTLHNGASITVTDRMRGMFVMLARVATGRMHRDKLRGRARELFDRRPDFPWKPLAPGTTAIHIPARPFIRLVIEDPAVQAQLKANWDAAVEKAITGK